MLLVVFYFCIIIKWNKVLIYATKWVNLENMLSERSHIDHCMIPFI